jgi:hypothetical protein
MEMSEPVDLQAPFADPIRGLPAWPADQPGRVAGA